MERICGISESAGAFRLRLNRATRLHLANIHGLMQLLTKARRGMPWSTEDRMALLAHLRCMGKALPAFGVFSLPGGMLLLPLLAVFLDRCRSRKAAVPAPYPGKPTGLS